MKKSTYHLRRSGDLIVCIGDHTDLSRAKAQAAADELWVFVGELFEYDDVDEHDGRRHGAIG